jgi:sulfopyruvate decarboxylase subunit alpha
MISGRDLVVGLVNQGVSHWLWIPDSELGRWEADLVAEPRLQLIRVSREAEAFGVAAGLMLGGKQPVVAMQCTGFFDAGDAFATSSTTCSYPCF